MTRILITLALTALACRQEAEVGKLAAEVGDGPDGGAAAPIALDLLFVVDDSGSMGEEQAALGDTFHILLDQLSELPGGLPSLHVGVISTNVGAGSYGVAGCEGDGDSGRLQSTPRLEGCSAPSGAFLADELAADGSRMRNYTGTLAEAFQCIALLGTNGCGFEQPLEAVKRALSAASSTPGDCEANGGFCVPGAAACPTPAGVGPDACPDPTGEGATCCADGSPLNACQMAGGQCITGDRFCEPPSGAALDDCGDPELTCCAVPPIDVVTENAGFLRADAHLAIIILSDEDDCSAADGRVFDPADESLGAPSSFRCVEYGLTCDGGAVGRTPATYEACEPRDGSYLGHPDRYIDFVRSLKPDEDQLFVGVIAGDRGPLRVVLDDAGFPSTEPTCTSASGSAFGAYRLGLFAERFSNHLVTSICAPDLTDALTTIARRLGDTLDEGAGSPGAGGAADEGGCSVAPSPGPSGAAVVILLLLASVLACRRTRRRLVGPVGIAPSVVRSP